MLCAGSRDIAVRRVVPHDHSGVNGYDWIIMGLYMDTDQQLTAVMTNGSLPLQLFSVKDENICNFVRVYTYSQ